MSVVIPDRLRIVDGVLTRVDGGDVVDYLQCFCAAAGLDNDTPVCIVTSADLAMLVQAKRDLDTFAYRA